MNDDEMHPLYGQKVSIYWNFHRKLFSVVHNGRVVDHVPHFNLKDATFTVQKAGNARVRKERRKNVHAFVRGTWYAGEDMGGLIGGVTYNPYRDTTFVTRHTGLPVHRAQYAAGTSFNNSAQLFACGWS